MPQEFTKKVLQIVAKIPRGKLMTYSEVAKGAGSPRAYRAVGNILNRNFHERSWQLPVIKSIAIPCHRVIRSDGQIGGYALGKIAKEKLLLKEGLKIKNHRLTKKPTA